MGRACVRVRAPPLCVCHITKKSPSKQRQIKSGAVRSYFAFSFFACLERPRGGPVVVGWGGGSMRPCDARRNMYSCRFYKNMSFLLIHTLYIPSPFFPVLPRRHSPAFLSPSLVRVVFPFHQPSIQQSLLLPIHIIKLQKALRATVVAPGATTSSESFAIALAAVRAARRPRRSAAPAPLVLLLPPLPPPRHTLPLPEVPFEEGREGHHHG